MKSGNESDRLREAELRAEVTRLEQQLDLATDAPARVEISKALSHAQRVLANHWKEVRNADPLYRELISSEQEFAGMEQVRETLLGTRDVMLAYQFGHFGGYVAVITQKTADVRPLALDAAQADALGVAAGPLVNLRLHEMMMNDKGDGIVQQLADPVRSTEVAPELATLWEVLVPAEVRKDLIDGGYERLLVLPDGALSFLPLEALVVEAGDDGVQYLLDAGPPVVYGPSATVMLNLARRRIDKRAAVTPVITLGDPAYRLATSGSSTRANTRLHLTRLPFSGRESQWVKEVFSTRGAETVQLMGDSATEGNLRRAIAGRELVHLACHGMSDDALGNLFGALALAPGREAGDPEDDGLLTLAEIYELDLDACELAILSACVTNYGPQNQGEGTWSLSRGFLVAGARRVVASNWVVDDEAGASLISYFCSLIAQSRERGETPDYAKCLQDAKQWIRKQQKWTNPFYWATFSLVGRG
jgi:CHAT domain-containing protein